MTFQPAYDIPLTYGGNTVWLRSSLQAATRLENLHGGFPTLLSKVDQFDTATLHNVITYAATDQIAAQAFLSTLRNKPLRDIQQACLGPVLTLIMALVLTNDATDTAEQTNSKPMAWPDLFADLFKVATGWLGWTPETAWNATLPEILHAFEGHTDQLKAIHGSAEEGDQDGPSADQQQANIEAGLDPEFDRAGLLALKQTSTTRIGQHI